MGLFSVIRFASFTKGALLVGKSFFSPFSLSTWSHMDKTSTNAPNVNRMGKFSLCPVKHDIYEHEYITKCITAYC